MFDFLIVGGGIVGLATARALTLRKPGARIAVLEKETGLARHQTGRNSGVIHSGIYYKPGSFKAEFSKRGRNSLVAFCRTENIPVEVCGKLIVATSDEELERLEALFERGRQNGLKVERLTSLQARAVEPHVVCVAALRVPETGITDYKLVCDKYAQAVRAAGGEIVLNAEVKAIKWRKSDGGFYRIRTQTGVEFKTKFLINCAGLQSDRVARLGGIRPAARIVPFRGEYYELAQEKRGMVKALIYPVPNPDFPFLGVHLTRMIDGSVHAGPNAVLALKREGYRWSEFNLRDLAETLSYPGFLRLARRNFKEGMKEIARSLSAREFLESLRRLMPELTARDIEPSQAGVRAQALKPDGGLVDDFLIEKGPAALHVLNAPSPAATCSLEIGDWVVGNI